MQALVYIFTLLFLLGSDSSDTVDSAATDTVVVRAQTRNLILSIDRSTSETGSFNDYLDIKLDSHGEPIAGLDIKIACNSELIDIIDIEPGELFDSCGWEFFQARPARSSGQPGRPVTVWQAVALAETVPDSIRPECLSLDRETSLLRVLLTTEHAGIVPDTTIPVYFFWEDCSDNTLSNATAAWRYRFRCTTISTLPGRPPTRCFPPPPEPPGLASIPRVTIARSAVSSFTTAASSSPPRWIHSDPSASVGKM